MIISFKVTTLFYIAICFVASGCLFEKSNDITLKTDDPHAETETDSIKKINRDELQNSVLYNYNSLSCHKCANYIERVLKSNNHLVFIMDDKNMKQEQLILKELYLTNYDENIVFISREIANEKNLFPAVNLYAKWDILKLRDGYPADTVNFSEIKVKVL